MERLYLDSSAFIKHFTKEKGSDTVDEIFRLCRDGRVIIVISSWTINESFAAIDRKYRRKEITLQERDKSFSTILAETDGLAKEGKVVTVPVQQEYVSSSLRYIIERRISADDALQLFSAIIGICSIFTTTDSNLLQAAEEEGFEAYNIEDESQAKELLQRI